MSQYFATFPAGTYEMIAKHLKSFTIEQLKISDHDDSSVIFQSSLSEERLVELRYFTNVYLIADKITPTTKSVLKGKYYRLMLLKDGTPQPLEQGERAKLEAKIKQEFRLEPNTHLSRNDFYLIERSSGKKLFTLRLPRAKFKRDKLPAGELRPELAHILCLVAGLKAKHTLVDMFAGYGSITYEAVRGFGCKKVIAVDKQELSNRHEHASIKWHEADARKLDFLEDNSIDRIVTDPPWGNYDKVDDLDSLYGQVLNEVRRILKTDGIVVILSGNTELNNAAQTTKGLKVLKSYPVLVSGKKATILKLQKVS